MTAPTTTPTGIPIIDCDTCGYRHPATRSHCPYCTGPHLFLRDRCVPAIASAVREYMADPSLWIHDRGRDLYPTRALAIDFEISQAIEEPWSNLADGAPQNPEAYDLDAIARKVLEPVDTDGGRRWALSFDYAEDIDALWAIIAEHIH